MRGPALFLILLLAGCLADPQADEDPAPSPGPPDAPPGPFAVASAAFEPEGDIPTKHSCDGDNVSPPLAFDGAAAEAETLALIMDDPDAPSGTVLHWTFWDVPADVTELAEADDIGALGGTEGQEYRGPCPPDGEHRYFFYAYAVNGTLGLSSGSSVDELRAALDEHAVQEAQMYGTYCRPQAPAVGCVLPMTHA